MKATRFPPAVAGPAWPEAEDRSLLFLTDAANSLERRLLRDWVERNRPPHVDPATVGVASVPRTRRHRSTDWKINPRLRARLNTTDNPLLVPLRIVWLPRSRDGERSVRWRDLLTLGDPRDPDWLRQRYLLWKQPERCRIVAGEPAPLDELRRRWEEISGDGDSEIDQRSIAEYVSLQAALALEQAERRVRGSRYKVPAFVHQDLGTRPTLVAELRRMAAETGESLERLAAKAERYFREIAATHSPYVIDLMAHAIRLLISRAYGDEVQYDRRELHGVYELGQRHPLVFLPSHKSNLDHLVLQLVLYENHLPPNHTAGGINMNFFPVGPLVRRSGVFFIRRSFKGNDLYKLVLQTYVRYLIEKRFTLEWYLEGGRSRSGKLREPRYGLLGYVVDAYGRAAAEDVHLVPVAIAYDQIQDVRGYVREQVGGAKQQESIGALFEFIRTLRKRHGAIHLRFGHPVSLREEIGSPAALRALPVDERHLAVQKLAFEVSTRINDATPITPISLMTLALLGERNRALSVEQTLSALEHYLNYLKQRDLPTTEELRLDTPERVRAALESLVDHGVVARYDKGPETVYRIGPEQHLTAAYYRNSIIHFFVNSAVAELALLAAADGSDPAAREEAFWVETLRLRDLLKFEFFFRRKDEYRREIEDELAVHDPLWRDHLTAGDPDAVLTAVRPLMSPWVLRPFLEAYRVVADVLVQLEAGEQPDEKDLVKRALALGKQYHLQGRVASAESVSAELFRTGLALARNQDLLEPGPGVEERRAAFAAEIDAVVRRVDRIEALAIAQRH